MQQTIPIIVPKVEEDGSQIFDINSEELNKILLDPKVADKKVRKLT